MTALPSFTAAIASPANAGRVCSSDSRIFHGDRAESDARSFAQGVASSYGVDLSSFSASTFGDGVNATANFCGAEDAVRGAVSSY